MEPGKIAPASMSANHRRVLSVRMRLLEDYCLQLLELLHPKESVLTSRPGLPRGKAAKLERALEAVRSKIIQIKGELELEHVHQNARREAAALMAAMRTNVEELHPRYLTGYGTVPDPLARYLQGSLKDLEGALDAVNQILLHDRDES
jgi:hypothetical protein